MSSTTVPIEICTRLVEAAARSCQPITPTPVPPAPATTTADSLAALSTSFTFGSILLAVLALIAGFTWGKIIAASAKDEAQKAAKECAEEWMAKHGPRIIKTHVEFINDATVGKGDDAKAADDIGKEA